MTREENTIYIRFERNRYECFGKTKGEGFIIAVEGSKQDNIDAAGDLLWAINKFGPEDYKNHYPLDTHPDNPGKHNYPVVEEKLS